MKGFFSPILIGAIAAGVVIAGLGLALKVQSARLDSTKADLEACSTRYQSALDSISKQNAAIDSLLAKAEKKRKDSEQALAVARKGQGKAQAEIARLKSLKPSGTSCPAGDAVSKVREGLN